MPGKDPAGLFVGRTFIEPCFGIVLLLFLVPAGKHAAQIFSIAKIFAQQRACIGVMDYIFKEIFFMGENIVYEGTKKNNV